MQHTPLMKLRECQTALRQDSELARFAIEMMRQKGEAAFARLSAQDSAVMTQAAGYMAHLALGMDARVIAKNADGTTEKQAALKHLPFLLEEARVAKAWTEHAWPPAEERAR